MEKILLFQLGAGGLSWLIFLAGLLWCNFAWWRVSRSREALLSMISALISAFGITAMVGLSVAINQGFIRSSILHSQWVESVSLVGFVLIGACWLMSSILFLLAAAAHGTKPVSQPHS